ncbi:putative nucleoside diphosphate kinase 2, ic [Roseibium sp. TrichSKD4]|uniref:hypothetical protein n=1 Tax=Roseibium sp. TrichSKD4 TaxID=744980 RepID=UPI0001E57613|nr:hypothetical protein [Roseibium sp. TrichSKD4]EFO30954.1 putative nucleoside diphosphate kinase 2, ic [Roseibium sp. TrichSKD4]
MSGFNQGTTHPHTLRILIATRRQIEEKRLVADMDGRMRFQLGKIAGDLADHIDGELAKWGDRRD